MINGDSVGVVEVFLHLRQVVLDRLYAQFPVNEIRDIIHRTRPVERIHRNEVLETLRMQLLEPFHHARRFELEHRGSIASAVEFVGRSIVYRYCLYVYFLSPTIADIVQTLVNDGKGVKAEEVHLEHSHTLDVMAVYLRSPDILVGFLILRKANRDMLGQVGRTYDSGAGVLSHLPDASLEFLGVFEYLLCEFGAVLKFIDKLRNEPVTILKCNLDINFLKSLLIGFSVDFNHFEAGFQIIQLRVEQILLGLFLTQTVWNHPGKTV